MVERLKLIALFLAVFAVAAGAAAAEKPLPTTCNKCNMKLDPANKKFSVTVSEGIEAAVYDDIGCALIWRDNECAMRMSAFDSNARVYDYNTGDPVVIEQAFFAHNAGVRTPMGYDIVAFKNKEDAAKLVKESGKGEVLTFNQLCSLKLK